MGVLSFGLDSLHDLLWSLLLFKVSHPFCAVSIAECTSCPGMLCSYIRNGCREQVSAERSVFPYKYCRGGKSYIKPYMYHVMGFVWIVCAVLVSMGLGGYPHTSCSVSYMPPVCIHWACTLCAVFICRGWAWCVLCELGDPGRVSGLGISIFLCTVYVCLCWEPGGHWLCIELLPGVCIGDGRWLELHLFGASQGRGSMLGTLLALPLLWYCIDTFLSQSMSLQPTEHIYLHEMFPAELPS